MALTDRFGLPLTTQSPQAAANYNRAVDLMLSANTGAEPLLDAALAADPDFALAHIARARLCQMQDHIGLSVRDLDAWVGKLRDEGVTFLEQPYRLGDTRAFMIEGSSREAIELVEVK